MSYCTSGFIFVGMGGDWKYWDTAADGWKALHVQSTCEDALRFENITSVQTEADQLN